MSYEPYNPATEQYKRFALAHETMLPPEAESDLFARIDGEDPTDSVMATEELATAHLALVAQIAGEYKDRGVFFDDLLSEGNLGLMKAVKKYDRTRKPGAFRAYASRIIRNYMSRACWERGRLIKVPASIVRKKYAIYQAGRQLLAELGREPTPAELSLAAKISPRTIRELREVVLDCASLDEPLPGSGSPEEDGDDNFVSRHEIYSTPRLPRLQERLNLAKKYWLELQAEVYGELDEIPQDVIGWKYGVYQHHPLEFEEISDNLDCSLMLVVQIHDETIGDMRKVMLFRAGLD